MGSHGCQHHLLPMPISLYCFRFNRLALRFLLPILRLPLRGRFLCGCAIVLLSPMCVYGRTYTLLLYWNRLLLSRGSRRRRKALLLFLFMHKAFRHKVAAGNYYYPYYLKPQTPPTPIVCWIPLDDVSNTTPFIQYTELTIGV